MSGLKKTQWIMGPKFLKRKTQIRSQEINIQLSVLLFLEHLVLFTFCAVLLIVLTSMFQWVQIYLLASLITNHKSICCLELYHEIIFYVDIDWRKKINTQQPVVKQNNEGIIDKTVPLVFQHTKTMYCFMEVTLSKLLWIHNTSFHLQGSHK